MLGDTGDSGDWGKPVYVVRLPHNGLSRDSGDCGRGFWIEHIEKLEGWGGWEIQVIGEFGRMDAREIGRCGRFGSLGVSEFGGTREEKARKKGGEKKKRRRTIKNKDKENKE